MKSIKLVFNSLTGLLLMPKHISCSDLLLQHSLNLYTKRNQSEFELILVYTNFYLIHRRWFGNIHEFHCYYPCDVIYSIGQWFPNSSLWRSQVLQIPSLITNFNSTEMLITSYSETPVSHFCRDYLKLNVK